MPDPVNFAIAATTMAAAFLLVLMYLAIRYPIEGKVYRAMVLTFYFTAFVGMFCQALWLLSIGPIDRPLHIFEAIWVGSMVVEAMGLGSVSGFRAYLILRKGR